MDWQYIAYMLLLAIASITSAGLAFAAWRRRPAALAITFALLMLALTEWSLGYMVELASAELATKVLWAKIEYLGIVSVPSLWLIFVLQYTGQPERLTRRNLILLTIEPIVTLLLVWTNEFHRLIWASVELDTSGAFPLWKAVHGLGFWGHAGYSYLLLFLGSSLIVQALLRSPHLYRRQAGALLIAAAAPWIGNALYLAELSPLDLTSIAFTLAGLVLSWSLFRFRLLDIVPVAHEVIFESMSDGVIVLDIQGRILDLNPAAQAIIERTTPVAIGQEFEQMLPEHDRPMERYSDVIQTREEIALGEGEIRRYYDLRISPLRDRSGHLTGRLVILHDVTETKRVEQELRQARDAAEAANQAKTVFLTNMSHELRTPLTSVIGYSELLQEEAVELECADLVPELESIRMSGKRLMTLINDVLALSRIEAGSMEIELTTFPLDSLIEQVTDACRALMDENDNTLRVYTPRDLGHMHADRDKVRHILLSLLDNAAKFTHEGQVTFSVTRETSANKTKWIRFRVADTGIGMSSEQMQDLYREFWQADPSETREYGGSGLRLALSQRFCQMMGGTIDVESESGHGSTFTVRLPAEVPARLPRVESAHTE